MADALLTLFPVKCRHEGCNERSTVFGFCKLHEAVAIDNEFAKLVEAGVAEQNKPNCFDTDRQWREYVVTFALANLGNKGGRHVIEHCRDCTPKHKLSMMAIERCAHPETVFIRSDRYKDVIGVPLTNIKHPETWEKAMMGLAGPVVLLPSSEVVNAIVQQLGQKKKRGRPRKVQP